MKKYDYIVITPTSYADDHKFAAEVDTAGSQGFRVVAVVPVSGYNPPRIIMEREREGFKS